MAPWGGALELASEARPVSSATSCANAAPPGPKPSAKNESPGSSPTEVTASASGASGPLPSRAEPAGRLSTSSAIELRAASSETFGRAPPAIASRLCVRLLGLRLQERARLAGIARVEHYRPLWSYRVAFFLPAFKYARARRRGEGEHGRGCTALERPHEQR